MRGKETRGHASRLTPHTSRNKAEATAFLPWSLPAAGFLIAGIALAVWGLPLWVGILTIFLPLLLYLGGWRWLALLALLLPVGFGRFLVWESAPNPLTPLFGEMHSFSGVSDGRYFTLDEPDGVRVALAPADAVPPGRATVLGELARVDGKQNPGGFNYRAYLRQRGVWGQLYVDEVTSLQPAPLSIKERLRRGVVAGLPERQAALMEAMTLGIRDNLEDLRDIFAASGLAHILSLSGLHVSILIAALGLLLERLGMGRRRYPLMIVFVLAFVMLVGAAPAVLRAGIMVIAVLVSLWLGAGRIEPWPALALAALLTLLWNPSFLLDLSFQLSYLAVAGMLLMVAPLMQRLFGERVRSFKGWHWQTWLVGGMVVSIAAQTLTLPLVVSTFGNLPLLGPLVNVLAVPIAGLLVPLGFLAALAGLISPLLAQAVNLLTGVFAGLLIALADVASSFPSLRWGEISAVGYLYYALGAAAIFLVLYGKLRPWRGLLVLSVTILSSMVTVPDHHPPEVVFLSVGQGDSTLIRLPGRKEILVDGGGSPFSDFDVGAEIVVPALRALGVDELELVVATHPDADHVEGLVSVLELMPVQRLIIGVTAWDSEVYRDLLATAKRHNIDIVPVVRGESLTLGKARLDFLNPPRDLFEASNDNSVAFVLSLAGMPKALLLGDISKKVEAELAFPDVHILLAPHHGSGSSTSMSLLRAAQPEIAVLSYGRNGYGHPDPAVLSRLAAEGVRVHETFLEGAVRLPLR